MTLGDAAGWIVVPVILGWFNYMAYLILKGRNPVLATSYKRDGKWITARHKDNEFTKLLGDGIAFVVIIIDLILVGSVIAAVVVLTLHYTNGYTP